MACVRHAKKATRYIHFPFKISQLHAAPPPPPHTQIQQNSPVGWMFAPPYKRAGPPCRGQRRHTVEPVIAHGRNLALVVCVRVAFRNAAVVGRHARRNGPAGTKKALPGPKDHISCAKCCRGVVQVIPYVPGHQAWGTAKCWHRSGRAARKHTRSHWRGRRRYCSTPGALWQWQAWCLPNGNQ
jgi:hypothetical protein